VSNDATEPKCPHCGRTNSYRLRKLQPPLGEMRTCQGCWRNFQYQTPEEQTRMDQATAAVVESRRVAIERIKRQAVRAQERVSAVSQSPVPGTETPIEVKE
jgi:transposase-like protein